MTRTESPPPPWPSDREKGAPGDRGRMPVSRSPPHLGSPQAPATPRWRVGTSLRRRPVCSSADTLVVGAVSDRGSPGPPVSAPPEEGGVTLSPQRGAPHSPPPSAHVPAAPGAQVRPGPGRVPPQLPKTGRVRALLGQGTQPCKLIGLQGLPGVPHPDLSSSSLTRSPGVPEALRPGLQRQDSGLAGHYGSADSHM